MKTTFLLIVAYMATIVNITDNNVLETPQDCNAELSVEKNRNYSSTDQEGTSFALILKNTSNETTTYSISAKNISATCSNSSVQTSGPNVKLKVSLKLNGKNNNDDDDDDDDRNSRDSHNSINDNSSKQGHAYGHDKKNKITLKSGESKKFTVKVSSKKKTKFNNWGCIEVKAKSQHCTSKTVKTVLSVYVPNPSEG